MNLSMMLWLIVGFLGVSMACHVATAWLLWQVRTDLRSALGGNGIVSSDPVAEAQGQDWRAGVL